MPFQKYFFLFPQKQDCSEIMTIPHLKCIFQNFFQELPRTHPFYLHANISSLNKAISEGDSPGWVRANELPGWDVFSIVTETSKRNIDYGTIIDTFKKAIRQRLRGKLTQALPLVEKLLIVEDAKRTRNHLSKTLDRKLQTGLNSGFFTEDDFDNRIRVKPIWGDYDSLYAMCYVAANNLDNARKFIRPLYDKKPNALGKNWWTPPLDDVALYATQICCDVAIDKGIKYLTTLNIKSDEYSEALALAYRSILLRSSVSNKVIHNLLEAIYKHVPS